MLPDAGRGITSQLRNFFVDGVTKSLLVVARYINVHQYEGLLASRGRLIRQLDKQMKLFHLYAVARLRVPNKNNELFSGTLELATGHAALYECVLSTREALDSDEVL